MIEVCVGGCAMAVLYGLEYRVGYEFFVLFVFLRGGWGGKDYSRLLLDLGL